MADDPASENVTLSPVVAELRDRESFLEKYFYRKSGAWTAFLTLMLVVFSGLLWRVSEKANDTSIVTQRAFVNPTGPILQKAMDGKKLKGIDVFYILANSGTTPANAGVSETNMSLGVVMPSKGLDFDSLPQSERIQIVLGPKSAFQTKPIRLSVDDLEQVAAGRKRLFFWGWITYHDVFNGTPSRLSEFCTEIDAVSWTKTDHFDSSGDVNTISPPCPVHNCYDEECEDYSRRVQ